MKMWRSFMSSRLRSMRDQPDRTSLFKTVCLLHQPCILGICWVAQLQPTSMSRVVEAVWCFVKWWLWMSLALPPSFLPNLLPLVELLKLKKKKKNPDWIETSNPVLYEMVASLPVWCQCLMLELNLLSFSPTVLCMLFLSDISEDCLVSKKKF